MKVFLNYFANSICAMSIVKLRIDSTKHIFGY